MGARWGLALVSFPCKGVPFGEVIDMAKAALFGGKAAVLVGFFLSSPFIGFLVGSEVAIYILGSQPRR